jgi:hypothetical protein
MSSSKGIHKLILAATRKEKGKSTVIERPAICIDESKKLLISELVLSD